MSTLLLGHGSYFAVTFVLILTGLGLPVPEEVAIIAAGVMASQGQMDPWLALASCVVGVLVGDLTIYAIGRHFGRNVVREHAYWAHFVTAQREARIEEMIRVHGLKVLFVARFLVGLRAPVYLTTGILHMPLRHFLLIDLFCATIVVGFFFLLSFRFGEHILFWIQRIEILATVMVVLVSAAVAVFLWRRYQAKRYPFAAAAAPDGEAQAEDDQTGVCVDEAKSAL